MDHKNLRNFTMTKQLNCRQVHWAESLADFEFQIHYKKENENDEANALSRRPDHEEVKQVHAEILSEDDNKIQTKGLTATYRVKNAPLMNEELIKNCHNNRVGEHLEVKRTENLVRRRRMVSDLCN